MNKAHKIKRFVCTCRFGSIESVRIRSLAATADVKMSKALQVKAGKTDSSKGSVNAYVLFSAAEHADAAHALNMTKIDGQHIRVDRAAPPKDAKSAGSVHYDSRRSVFVGNLPRDVQVCYRTLRAVFMCFCVHALWR